MSPSHKQFCRFVVVFGLALATAVGAAAQPAFTKVFLPDTIGPGSATKLTFTINNMGGAGVTGLAFSDTLPAGVTLASPASPGSFCGGTLTAPDGGGTITFTDGVVGPGAKCTISVHVTSSTAGTHMNTSGDLTSSAGNSGTATDDLTVATDRPGFTKSFSPSSVPLGNRATLTFTIDNSANGSQATALQFIDNLPTGIVVANPANTINTCNDAPFLGGVVTAVPGSSTVSLGSLGGIDSAAVAAGGTCTVSVDVVTSGTGLLANTSNELSSLVGFNFFSSGKAVANLTSTAATIALIKRFLADPVPPGGTVALEFTILNRSRDFEATGVTFTDNLGDAGGTLTGLAAVAPLPTNPCGVGSTLSGTTTLTLTNGTIPAQGSCTFTVTLQVPAMATPGIYPNTTSAVSGTLGGPVVGNQASDDLFVFAAPILTKTFLDDPVAAGDSTRMEFTITNTSLTDPATDISFIDDLTAFLPFPISAVLPAPGFCNGTGSIALLSLGFSDTQGLFVTGASLAAGASCTFEVTLNLPNTLAAGIYTNVTDEITAMVDMDKVIGNPATADFEVVGGVILNKEFTDDPVSPGDTVTLQFSLQHDENATSDATDITFTDDLDATLTGLTSIGLPLMNICGAGSQISESMGTLTLTGGTLGPGEMCQFSVTLQVPMAATAGTYPNTTSTVDATVSGLTVTTPTATDDLIVAGLTLTKEFTNDPVIPGGTVTLQFTLNNDVGAPTASSIFFQDNLDATLANLAAVGAFPMDDLCGPGNGSLAAASGNKFLTFSGGSLNGGETCQFSVTLSVPAASASGIYPNLTQTFFSIIDSNVVFLPNAADDLIVAGDLLQLTKTFLTNPVAPGAMVDLQFELTNLSASGAASGIAFTDNLGAALTGLVATGLPTAGCGGTATANPDAGTIDFSGGTLGIGASCTFTVTVQVPAMPAASSAINTTSMVTGMIGGLGVTGDPASDTLRIQDVDFTKSFAGPTTAGGTVVLTFTIDNLTATPMTNLGFTDDLNAVIPGLVATGLPLVTPCGALSSLTGTSFLTLSGGDLAGNASCMFNVTLQMPAAVSAGMYPNTTSALFASGLQVADPATDTLEVEPPPTFAKVFAPDIIAAGGVSTLTFTIDNSASAVVATNLAFLDSLPSGVVVASPNNASTTCTGGTLTAVAGSGMIQYAGGSVMPMLSCMVSADVTSAAAGVFLNTTGDLTSDSGNSGPASDTLTVNPQPTFGKAFSPTLVALDEAATLTFTIDNTGSGVDATGLAFMDNLPAGMEVANPANAMTDCGAGMVTAAPGDTTISFTGGSVMAGAMCIVSVNVVSGTLGANVNVTEVLSSSLGASAPATGTLIVGGSVTEIPTLGTWSLLLLMLGLGLLGVWRLRG